MKKTRLFNVALLFVCVLFVSNSLAQDYTRWSLPEGAKARLGKGSIKGIAYSPDGARLAIASSIGIWLYDAPTGAEVALLTGHTGPVHSVAFSPDGKILASGGGDGTIWLWDMGSGQLQTILEGHAVGVSSLSFSPDGTTLASRSWDGTILLWDVDSGQPKETLEGHTDFVTTMAFSPDGGSLASLEEYISRVTSVAFSPDGSTLASGTEHGMVLLWDMGSGQRKATLQRHTDDAVLSVKFSPDGSTLASGTEHGTILLWDVDSGQQKATLQRHTNDAVLSVKFSPDSRTVGNVEFLVYRDGITYMAFSLDGTTLAGGSEHEIWLWDVGNGQPQAIFKGHADVVLPVAFSLDGTTLAGGSEHEIWLWDVDSGQPKASLQGHTNFVTSVAFSPDGSTLASGSWDGTVLLWDTGGAPTHISEAAAERPAASGLEPNVPNPFNASTQIPYRLATPGLVRLVIYNTLGQRVRTLVDEFQPVGFYQAHWDAHDQGGARVAAGVYFTRLHYPTGVETQRLLYLK